MMTDYNPDGLLRDLKCPVDLAEAAEWIARFPGALNWNSTENDWDVLVEEAAKWEAAKGREFFCRLKYPSRKLKVAMAVGVGLVVVGGATWYLYKRNPKLREALQRWRRKTGAARRSRL